MEFEIRLLSPAYEFIESLPVKMQSKVYRTIDLLREFGYRLREPYSKSLRYTRVEGTTGEACHRHLSAVLLSPKGTVYVITSGYIKKKNETDKNEIKRTLRLMENFLKGKK